MSDIEAAAAAHKKTLGYKAALTAVIILSTLIILAVIALVAGAVTKFSGKGEAVAPATPSAQFTLPAGAQILSQETQPGRLILHVRTGEGEEIDIIDTGNGKLISRIKAAKAE